MWFDARAKLEEIAGHPLATSATTATQAPAVRSVSRLSQVSQPHEPANRSLHVAEVASVATTLRSNMETAPVARTDGLEPDAGAYFDRLHLHGPQTYGAMASALRWGATRAWQAEAKLRALGMVNIGPLGQAHPLKETKT